MRNLVFFLFIAIFTVGCGGSKKHPVDGTIYKPVNRIFYHEMNHVSLFCLDESSKEVKVHKFDHTTVKFVADVPENQPCWASYHAQGRCNGTIIIHIHNSKQVEGGGWDHGKRGNGQTQVIE